MKWFLQLVIISACLFSCKGADQKAEQASYESSKKTLAGKEKNNPLLFLKVSWTNHKSFLGFGKTVVNGKVTNTASVCAYKDVRVKMLCYKLGTLAEEHEDVLDETLQPNSSNDFKTKYRLPKGTDSIALSIMSATALPVVSK